MMSMYKSLICFRIGIIKSTENFFLEEPMSGEIDTITCFFAVMGEYHGFLVMGVLGVCEKCVRYLAGIQPLFVNDGHVI